MKKKSPTIIFFGTEDFSAESLKRLIFDGYTVGAVVTKPDSRRHRGKKLTEPPVKQIAKEHNIPVWQPENIVDITDNIKNIENRLGILVSYGKIIPEKVLNLFEPIGIVNVHPSLLPKYRGPSPIESAILNGDSKTGVTIMKLSKEMDAGPIYSQVEVDIDEKIEVDDLYSELSFIGATELTQVIEPIFNQVLTPKLQKDSEATYCQLIKKENGFINWNQPAEQLEREIRAYSRWPGSHSKLGEVEVVVTQAKVQKMSDPTTPGSLMLEKKRLFVATKKDWLEILRLQPKGKKEMPITAFLAGYRDKLS